MPPLATFSALLNGKVHLHGRKNVFHFAHLSKGKCRSFSFIQTILYCTTWLSFSISFLTEANYSQILLAWKVVVTFINCHLFRPVVLFSPLHKNKLSIPALLNEFFFHSWDLFILLIIEDTHLRSVIRSTEERKSQHCLLHTCQKLLAI